MVSNNFPFNFSQRYTAWLARKERESSL